MSPSTDGASVAVYPHGAPRTPANLVTSVVANLSPGSAACGGHTGFPRTCTATLALPPDRSYDAVVDTYNAPPSPSGSFAGASLLAAGSLDDVVVKVGKANDWSVFLSGVIYGLTGEPAGVSLAGDGTTHKIALIVDPEDFGNKPLSAGSKDPFANPIVVSVKEFNGTGHISLSLDGGSASAKVTVSKSTDRVALTYDGLGGQFYGATVTLNAPAVQFDGGATETMNVSPLILVSNNGEYSVPKLSLRGNGDVTLMIPTERNPPAGTVYSAKRNQDCPAVADVTKVLAGFYGIPYVAVFARGMASKGGCTIAFSDGTSTVDVDVANAYAGILGWTPTVSKLGVPSALAQPSGITVGPDGAMWFGENTLSDGGYIATVEATGSSPAMQDWALATGAAGYVVPDNIIAGPDGHLWTTDFGSDGVIASTNTSGSGTAWMVAGIGSDYYPKGIAVGSDGNLWFAEAGANSIGRVTTGGTVGWSGVLAPGTLKVSGATLGPDGNVWFTEQNVGFVGRIAPDWSVTQIQLPANAQPNGITAGPDGALWFVDDGNNAIGRIPISAEPWNPQVTEYTGLSGSLPQQITTGPDGALWFTEEGDASTGPLNGKSVVGRIDPNSHAITEYTSGDSGAWPYGIAAGPDGAIWFTEYKGYNVDRVSIQTSSAIRRTTPHALAAFLSRLRPKP